MLSLRLPPALRTLQRGAVKPQTQRHKLLVGTSGGPSRQQQQQQQQQGGAGRQKQQRQQQEMELELLATKCKICFQPPAPGKKLKQVQVGAGVQVCAGVQGCSTAEARGFAAQQPAAQ